MCSNNILEHFYDGGDCCGVCINTDLCTKCNCIDKAVGDGIPNVLVGDGFCNDETNIADCKYDGGDCCGSCVNSKAWIEKINHKLFIFTRHIHLCFMKN